MSRIGLLRLRECAQPGSKMISMIGGTRALQIRPTTLCFNYRYFMNSNLCAQIIES